MATQIIAVIIFVLIEFSLIIIPFAFLELRPAATKARLKNAQDWLLGHAVILGACLAIMGMPRQYTELAGKAGAGARNDDG